MSTRVKRSAVLLADQTFGRIHDAFVDLLTANGLASRDEILIKGEAIGLKHIFSFLELINVVRVKQPKALILPLSRLIFYGPSAKARIGKTPRQYICQTYKHAYGFALVAKFAHLGELHRQIVETRYKAEDIRAARALERVHMFREALLPLSMPQVGGNTPMPLFAAGHDQ